ncbi:MAG TPA: hypothetical protein VD884_06650 [Ohtaekwangia sp.]|nr:hypothetical protein [Ohtaekwangia sp.]
MKFSDILSLFRQGKSTARSHIKNLIEMAVVDGNFDLVEHNLLARIAERNNLSQEHLQKIKANPASVQFELPQDSQEKFVQFFDLVHMMTIDKTIHHEEMNLCNIFAVKFGYPRYKASDIISSIQGNIANGQDSTETYKRVAWMLH